MEGLFERGRELDQLEIRTAHAVAGDGHVVVVEGPAGIGKSGLLAELRGAGGPMRVLSARAGEFERDFPFGVVRQLFEPFLSDPERRERWLADAAARRASV